VIGQGRPRLLRLTAGESRVIPPTVKAISFWAEAAELMNTQLRNSRDTRQTFFTLKGVSLLIKL
jgi:D-lyxose ketol-isomerase